jgi:hypothetical protein
MSSVRRTALGESQYRPRMSHVLPLIRPPSARHSSLMINVLLRGLQLIPIDRSRNRLLQTAKTPTGRSRRRKTSTQHFKPSSYTAKREFWGTPSSIHLDAQATKRSYFKSLAILPQTLFGILPKVATSLHSVFWSTVWFSSMYTDASFWFHSCS